MKKKKALALLLAAALQASLLALPAGAYYLCDDGYSIYANQETQKFWEVNRQRLYDREIYPLSADNNNFCGEFHDGLLLVQEAVTVPADRYPGLNDNYVNKSGEVVDLNRNRYDLMFSFSNGYAAAAQWHAWSDEGERGGVAYVDTSGREAVPLNKDWSVFRVDYIDYAGRFENGRALVVREIPGEGSFSSRVYSTSVDSYAWDKWRGIEYAYINTSGKLLTSWKRTDDPNEVMKLPLYDRNNVWIGYRLDPAAWAANDWSVEAIFGGSASGSEVTPEEPQLPVNATYGLANAAVRGYTIEGNVGYLLVDIENPNPAPDAGDLFVVTYAKYAADYGVVEGGSFVPTDFIRQVRYEVEANGSKTVKIPTSTVYGVEASAEDLAEGWYDVEGVEDHRIVLAQAETPEEAEELVGFFSAIHDYGEVELGGWSSDGTRCLALPMAIKRNAAYLDQKLSWFTSQF